ncbi:MAG: hypothetical protein IRZ09_14555 [Variibacter sp.]|nr:hypothetical protein [Variibacter sp.]
MATFSEAELQALEAGSARIGAFFFLDTTPAVRLWCGVGNIEPGVNAIDATGAAYKGLGALADVPEFQQLLNGHAERVEFTLSGVSADVLEIASAEDAPAVKGRLCALGIGLMTEDWSALLGPVHWLRRYRADFLAVRQDVADDPGQPVVRTVVLSVGSLTTGRRRPALSFFTDQDQQRRSPGDRFCERTPLYSQEITKRWPDF